MMNDGTGFNALSGGEWTLLIAIWLLTLLIVGAVIVYLMRERNVGRKDTASTQIEDARAHHHAVLHDAMATLDQRLARGEIDSVAYDAQRDRLERRQWNGVERRATRPSAVEGEPIRQ